MNQPAQAPTSTSRRIPVGRWILLGVVMVAIWSWTLGPTGVIRQSRDAAEVERLRARVEQRRDSLRQLADSLESILHDTSAQRREARRQGWALPGEVVIRFVDTTSPSP